MRAHVIGFVGGLVLVAAACSPPADDDPSGADAGAGGDAGMSPDADPGMCPQSTEGSNVRSLVPERVLPAGSARSCAVTVRVSAPNESQVQIAGDFTGWADAPLSLADAGGGEWEITLDPATHGIVPGTVHAYKLIYGGTDWRLDSASPRRAMDGSCWNSAFAVPACDAGPEILAEAVATEVGVDTGSATARFKAYTATDGVAIASVDVELDGQSVPASAISEANGVHTVSVDDVALGKHVLVVRASDAQGRDAEPVSLPFWLERRPFDWRDAVMYMIVVDRFANGRSDNDAPESVEYPADWHGGDLWGALDVMKTGYFEDLGVNVIWLSPINAQAAGSFEGRDDSHMYAGYHGYWPSRGREVDSHFGGNDGLKAFVDEAHSRGIRVLFDLINNQVHDQHEYLGDHPDWFRDTCVCGIDPGCGWSERPYDCQFATYLPDINWLVPGAEAQFVDDAMFWIEQLGIDGYRIDAVKHVEASSVFTLRDVAARRFEQGGERVYMVGETAVNEGDTFDYDTCGGRYDSGYEWINDYVGTNGLDGQFDFPAHHRMQHGLLRGYLGYDELDQIVNTAESEYTPDSLHVRFLGTHDSTRMASQAAEANNAICKWQGDAVRDWDGTIIDSCSQLPDVATGGETYARLRRAFTVLMTMPGVPFIYYGDEVAMPGGNDPDNRRDMVWTDDLAGVAMGATTLTAEQTALREWVRALGQARRDSNAMRRGQRVTLVAEPDLYIYAYKGDGPGDLALVAVNKGAAVTGRAVPLSSIDLGCVTSFDPVVGTGAADIDSNLTITIGAGESAVFIGR